MNGKQLKNSILQWAIQGKLVPQDPNDEPASVLLEKIRQEKERLIKEKKIKRDKNASIIYRGEDNSYYEKFLATGEVKCIDEEIPFEVPQGWEWCRLRDIIIGTNAGKSPNCEKRPKRGEEWGVLTTTAIQENEFLPNENKVLPPNYIVNSEHSVKYGDILITRAGPVNRTGVVCLVDKECDNLILSDKTVRIDYLRNYCNPTFIVLVLNSPSIHDILMSVTVGMAASQVNVSQGNIQHTLIPFPGIKEQNRIVAKITNLLPIIKRYNSEQEQLEELNAQLPSSLKKSILQEAIQGKLVKQIESEGTADELLSTIRKEKEKLAKQGKLKKSSLIDSVIFKGDDNKYYENDGKNVVCIDTKIPFEIPSSWQWVRLANVVQVNPKNDAPDDTITAFIPMECIDAIYLSKYTYHERKWGDIKSSFTHFAEGDVAFAKITPCFQNRKSMILRNLPNGIGAGTTELKVLRPYGKTIDREYLLFFLESPYFVEEAKFKGTANQQRIVSEYMENKLFPLPPLSEQQRISDKIKEAYKRIGM